MSGETKAAKPADTSGPDESDLSRILQDEGSKQWADLRDRAAYVFATGAFPTHLRRTTFSRLVKVTRMARKPVALDGRSGLQEVTPEMRVALKLDEHPMVVQVRKLLGKGYLIHRSSKFGARRTHSRVYLYKKVGEQIGKLIVQSDGSLIDGWPK